MLDESGYVTTIEKICGLLRQFFDGACFNVTDVYRLNAAEKERFPFAAVVNLFQGETFYVQLEIKERKTGLIWMRQLMDENEEKLMLFDHMFDELVLGSKRESVCGLLRWYLDEPCFDVLSLSTFEDEEGEIRYYAEIKLFRGRIFNVGFEITKEKVESVSIWPEEEAYVDPVVT